MLPKVVGGHVTSGCNISSLAFELSWASERMLGSKREGRVFNQFRRLMKAGPRAATPAYKPLRLLFFIAIDPPARRQAGDSIPAAQVRY